MMTPEQLDSRLRSKPTMCQTWISAVPMANYGGALYLSSISDEEERMGMAHIYIWDKSDMGKPANVRQAANTIMEENELDRLVVEINEKNRLAIKLASRVGFRPIGTVRKRKKKDGSKVNVLLMDALPEDLSHG
jgi:RimJ/RimL family protein N-acetyltransferase